MGTNKLLWFFPIKLSLGMPIGNGIDWFDKLLYFNKGMKVKE